jgi:hypothetical protein
MNGKFFQNPNPIISEMLSQPPTNMKVIQADRVTSSSHENPFDRYRGYVEDDQEEDWDC